MKTLESCESDDSAELELANYERWKRLYYSDRNREELTPEEAKAQEEDFMRDYVPDTIGDEDWDGAAIGWNTTFLEPSESVFYTCLEPDYASMHDEYAHMLLTNMLYLMLINSTFYAIINTEKINY